ncbi:pimeloyl-ACP methyl ester carboxylesterase [Microterricola gilva]|uniref:Pimeloyl-ACP methyl ester carboxylesterase n=1 Tax=Microterricola gilva TaxID=393267 RepID=A0A4Q8ANQ9_9MICO|nr:alpha/beta hydrolase [Microterricola gilva]RZU65589.1 pimeloyl-ACP methyl ester carboxylesterase [Microterricola gilva]
MKKFLRITLRTLGVIVAVIALALATTAVVNVTATTAEAERIESYGQLVPVDGKNMNVVISGAGDETIVLLPGFGTAAPALDFSPLITELATDYRVVAVEPFGYGLSDGTEKARTSENIANEVHEALQALDIDRYVLMGHSIAGIYGLEYTEHFRDEVTAFVGIDSSVPDQPGMDKELPLAAMQTAKTLGLMRVLYALSDPYAGLDFDTETAEQMTMLSAQNSLSTTYVNELKHIAENFAAASARTFPHDLPVLLFAQAENPDFATWAELHEEQAASVEHGEVVFLDGDHYLHHTLSPEIADDTARFLSALGSAPAA